MLPIRTIDIAAEGGATSEGLSCLSDELWERSPAQTGAEDKVTSYLCSDVDVQRLRHLEPAEEWQVPRTADYPRDDSGRQDSTIEAWALRRRHHRRLSRGSDLELGRLVGHRA